MKIDMKIIVWLSTLCMLVMNIAEIINIPWLVVFAPVLCWYSVWIISIVIIIISLALYSARYSKKKEGKNNE